MIIHSLNAKGKFYVDQHICTYCAACEYVPPKNFAIDEIDYGAYISKQPETADELEQVREAVCCCPVEAIMDDGATKNQ